MKINYVNPEHVHALVDLPTRLSLEDQEEHRKNSLAEEFKLLVKRYELQWRDD